MIKRITLTDIPARPKTAHAQPALKTYAVTVDEGKGPRPAGRIELRWFAHIKMEAWEATAADGSHGAVHAEAWQAAWACTWDGVGYPFPVHPRYRSLVSIEGAE